MPVLVGPGTIVIPPIDDPPPPGPVLPIGFRTGFRNILRGWDGTSWELSDYRGGVFFTPGVVGYNMPPIENYRSVSPAVAGSTYRGSRTSNRDVFWPTFLYSNGSNLDWIDFDSAFWDVMDPTKVNTWDVIDPRGNTRSLDVRYESLADGSSERDPATVGWALYGINLLAEQPYWRGKVVTRTFKASDQYPFFGGPGVIYQVNSSQQLATATIPNPGKISSYVTWTLAGPFESATVGIIGRTITLPFAVAQDEAITIYTQPDQMQALDNRGRERTQELGATSVLGSRSVVPPGAAVPLALNLVNPGPGAAIQADLIPLHYRAWGPTSGA